MNIDNSNHLPVGFQLGDFSIVRVAGEGGFSVVYVADDNLLGRTVAIKEYLPTSVAARGRDLVTVQPRSSNTVDGFQTGLRSFIREARLLAQFSHPAIVEVYRVWEQNGTAYIAMRFLRGETLSHHIRNQRVFSEDELRIILEPIFDAIELLHSQNIIHRDVSPDNIIVADGQPVLLDLGAARAVVAGLTQALTSVLKPGYAPIEQYADDGSLQQGTWTDVYAIAGVLYKLATGVTPVQAIGRVVADPLPSMQSLGGNFSNGFAESVMAGLAVFPEQRIKTVSELRDRLGWRVVSEQLINTKVPVVGNGESAEADVQTPAKMRVNLWDAPAELPQHAHLAPCDLDDRTVVVPRAKSFQKKVSSQSPIAGAGESAQLLVEPDDHLSVLVHGALTNANQPNLDPAKRQSGTTANRRWYGALASLALVAMLFGAYRVWLSATNSAVPSSSPANSSSALATTAELVPRGEIGRKYLPGEKIELTLRTNGSGHAYCFWLDEAKQIIRIHPNRFNISTLVSADLPLALPGTSDFSLIAERAGIDQNVECYVVPTEILRMLPAQIAGADLTVLSVRSLDEVRNSFASAVGTGIRMVTASYVIRVEAR